MKTRIPRFRPRPRLRLPALHSGKAPGLALAAALLLVYGCTDTAPTASGERPLEVPASARVIDWTSGGLEQEVVITPARPRLGDTLTVRSTVRNPTRHGVVVEARVCGLDLDGPLILEIPGVRCGGWSARRTLAPGASFRVEDRRVYRGVQGEAIPRTGTHETHRIRVRHLVNPERWVVVELSPRG
jgi:hypothetical protein